MPTEIVLQPSPHLAALLEQRERLTALRTALANRESDLTQLRAELKLFETRYLAQVGILYVTLDDLEARIAEREVDLYDSDAARRRARQARQRAQETHEAAFSEELSPKEFDPPPSLKTLFREVARRIHPDFASDDAEQKHFTLLMTRANQAYGCGDTESLQRLLDDYLEVHASLTLEGDASELLRMTRQIQHAERDLATLDAEQQTLRSSEIGQLQGDAQAAAGEGRDLLAELAHNLTDQIADAQHRFELVDRQISAHGR